MLKTSEAAFWSVIIVDHFKDCGNLDGCLPGERVDPDGGPDVLAIVADGLEEDFGCTIHDLGLFPELRDTADITAHTEQAKTTEVAAARCPRDSKGVQHVAATRSQRFIRELKANRS